MQQPKHEFNARSFSASREAELKWIAHLNKWCGDNGNIESFQITDHSGQKDTSLPDIKLVVQTKGGSTFRRWYEIERRGVEKGAGCIFKADGTLKYPSLHVVIRKAHFLNEDYKNELTFVAISRDLEFFAHVLATSPHRTASVKASNMDCAESMLDYDDEHVKLGVFKP